MLLTQFLCTTIVADSVDVDGNCDGDLADAGIDTTGALDASNGGDIAEYDATNEAICIYPGNTNANNGTDVGGTDTCDVTGPTYDGTGGTVAGSATTCVFFSVTIDN